MKTSSDIEWIFFDWGGTLKDEFAIYQEVARVAASCLRERDALVGERTLCDRLIELERQDEAMRVERAVQDLGGSEEDGAAASEAVASELGSRPAPSYVGAKETLVRLGERFKLGLISNHRSGLDLRLQMDELGRFFDVAIGSGDVGVRKPAPKIFEIALDRAGCDATHAAMIGDRLSKDISGANRVGMYSVRIKQGIYADDEPVSEDERPDAEIEDIRQAATLFL